MYSLWMFYIMNYGISSHAFSYHVPLGEEEIGSDVLKEVSEAFLQPHILPPHRRDQVPKPLWDKRNIPDYFQIKGQPTNSLFFSLSLPWYHKRAATLCLDGKPWSVNVKTGVERSFCSAQLISWTSAFGGLLQSLPQACRERKFFSLFFSNTIDLENFLPAVCCTSVNYD